MRERLERNVTVAMVLRATSAKAFAYALAQWVLLWSLWRLVTMPAAFLQSSPAPGWRYDVLVAMTGGVALGYAVLAYWLLAQQSPGDTIRTLLRRSRRLYFLGWLTPVLLWTLALGLHILAISFTETGSVVDGPVLVLIVSGFVVLLFLLGGEHVDVDNPAKVADDELFTVAPDRGSAKTSTIAAIVLISMSVLFIFREGLFHPEQIVYGKDLFAQYYPLEVFVREALSAGHLPLWNPYFFSGSPALAHSQYLLFYPPQMLLRLLPVNMSISWNIAFHVWLAGVGMFLLCRRFRLDSWIALLCAAAYMLNGGMMLRVASGHVWLVYALCWFPLAWLLFEKALMTGRAGALASATLIISLLLLTGHPAFPLYLLFFLTAFALYVARVRLSETRSWTALLPLGARYTAMMLGAAGLSAIQLVPAAILSRQAFLATGYNPHAANWLALTLIDLIAFVIPHLYREPFKRMLIWEMIPYMGIFFLLALPLALLLRPRRPFFYFLAGVSAVAVVIAFGTSLGVYHLLYNYFPPLRFARIPPRSLVMLIPALILLGGFALQGVQQRNVAERWLRWFTHSYLMAALFVMAAAGSTFLVQRNNVLAQALEVKRAAILGFVVVFALLYKPLISANRPRAAGWTTFVQLLRPAGVILSGFLTRLFILPPEQIQISELALLAMLIGGYALLLTFLYRHGPEPMTVLMLFALLLLDLGPVNLRYIYGQSPPQFYQDERLLLRGLPIDEFDRVLSVNDPPNHYSLGHVAHIDGYNAGIPSGYNEYLRTVTHDSQSSPVSIVDAESTVDPRALDFLGVRYVIRPEPVTVGQHTLLNHRSPYYLHTNPDPLPRAFVVYEAEVAQDDVAKQRLTDKDFDYARQVVLAKAPPVNLGGPGEAVIAVEPGVPYHGELNMTVSTSAPGILVLSEPYYSERKVYVDGEEARVLRANLGFMAVALGAGEHQVEVRYVPTSLYVGASITLGTVLLGVAALLYVQWRRR